MKKVLFTLFAVLILASCATKKFKEKWLEKEAPATFKARFETTQGNFDIEAVREWSPAGVDRLYQLITHNYYEDVSIFRVVPNFVAQFGIHNDTLINNAWGERGVKDEPVLQKNDSMTIAFARGGVETRSNQIFINLKKNYRLDKLAYSGVTGFPVIAKVIDGQENVLKFYGGYGDKLGYKQDSVAKFGNVFLREKYPKVDYIKKAYILKE
ncbi:peptidylprolyl isomerase [Polaribacter dokdonensis]|uniref:peptidylprolyl isomerase n=1 Tax=Polaribacter dokdonensis DSW-5 TaxID=1300348 RepID=A0A0M9CGJ3_9FLAO|nr:peptidylprolyl isomerase [Polaribacter dokdonensis]KOY52102.1 Peptidyl-prolyl cis-trans isomerase A [Polaribacter dokdonensis DSW-5]SED95718.1 Peptidyl-prolyl cis-trans isomerase (rotamase)-cyclophilin family [Polaribacter dokdonensis DSW-5]